MKRAMNQSLLSLRLNGVSVLSLIFLILSLFAYDDVTDTLHQTQIR